MRGCGCWAGAGVWGRLLGQVHIWDAGVSKASMGETGERLDGGDGGAAEAGVGRPGTRNVLGIFPTAIFPPGTRMEFCQQSRRNSSIQGEPNEAPRSAIFQELILQGYLWPSCGLGG